MPKSEEPSVIGEIATEVEIGVNRVRDLACLAPRRLAGCADDEEQGGPETGWTRGSWGSSGVELDSGVESRQVSIGTAGGTGSTLRAKRLFTSEAIACTKSEFSEAKLFQEPTSILSRLRPRRKSSRAGNTTDEPEGAVRVSSARHSRKSSIEAEAEEITLEVAWIFESITDEFSLSRAVESKTLSSL